MVVESHLGVEAMVCDRNRDGVRCMATDRLDQLQKAGREGKGGGSAGLSQKKGQGLRRRASARGWGGGGGGGVGATNVAQLPTNKTLELLTSTSFEAVCKSRLETGNQSVLAAVNAVGDRHWHADGVRRCARAEPEVVKLQVRK